MTESETHNPLDAGVDLHALDDLTLDGRVTVLDRLGPAHFRSKGFSFMGFLQTVYDHVAEHATGNSHANASPVAQTSEAAEAPPAPADISAPDTSVEQSNP